MAWFAVILVGALNALEIIRVPIHWVVIGCGVALLYDLSQRSKFVGT